MNKKNVKITLILLISTLVFGTLAGCGNGNDTAKGDTDVQIVNIEANDNYEFNPNQVEVHTGKIKLVVKNVGKRMHGFGIKELDIDEQLAPGQTIEKVVEINEPGTYEFECTVLCGTLSDHKGMMGKLVVK